MQAVNVLGIDLGTGGARAVVATTGGELVASGEAPIEARFVRRSATRHEQDPAGWWSAVEGAVREAVSLAGTDPVAAIAVDATSGTLLGLDEEGRATTPGLMYNDGRASTPLGRLRWFADHDPRAFEATRLVAHQADWITGRLTGSFGVSDHGNALKSGFALVSERWSEEIEPELRARLPEVVASGTRVGELAPGVARRLGLSPGTAVFAGLTDGTAGFLASGACRHGDDSTTLGTTLVFKRLAPEPVQDPRGIVYCHKLPHRPSGDAWIPGAASNTGAEWIRHGYAGEDPGVLDEHARPHLPSPVLAYPLHGRGERFPFSAPEAEGFCLPEVVGVERYAAMLQGTACVERLAYEVLDRLTGTAPRGDVYVTGGGSASDLWLQLRADVTGRTLHRPAHPSSAFGAAVLAAAGLRGEPPMTACKRMVSIERTFRPDPARAEAFGSYHARFVDALRARGYLSDEP